MDEGLNSLLEKKLPVLPKRTDAVDGKAPAKTSGAPKPAPVVVPSILDVALLEREKLTKEQVNEYLIRALQSTAREDGWANTAALGLYLRTYTPVDYKTLGHATLKKFLESTKLFEMKAEQKSSRAAGLDSASVRLLLKG